jgi:hypothetical protein
MGNDASSTTAPSSIFREYEHQSGRRLIAAIRANSKEATKVAITFARKEFTKPFSSVISNASDYDEMAVKMERYLTKPYDIGDGVVFKKTPLEYANSINAKESIAVIEETLTKLRADIHKSESQSNLPLTPPTQKAAGVVERPIIGEVTRERAELAKERLKAFQQNTKNVSKS